MSIKKILFIALLFPSLAQAQKPSDSLGICSFTWSNSLAYLPSPHSESEVYTYNKGRLKHKYSKTRRFWPWRWQGKRWFTATNKKKVVAAAYTFLRLSEQDELCIKLTQTDKDSLMALANKRSHMGYYLYGVEPKYVLKYTLAQDSILIDVDEFATPYSKKLENMIHVIDGAPFSLNFDVSHNCADTLHNKYKGNLVDHVKNTAVPNFLIYYLLYQEYRLFRYTAMHSYFNKQQLYAVLLRYIAIKEGLINDVELPNIGE